MRNVVFIMISVLGMTSAFAQNNPGSVKGTIRDSVSLESLQGVSVYISKLTDSSNKKFTLTSDNGFFEINNIDTGSYNLIATHQGLEAIKKLFTISVEKNSIDFGPIKMQKAYKTLNGVVVKDVAPIKMNGDTVAYKASAFKTRENASVEDLLKKLPGIQVDRNGAVKAQGEQVQKIYVDGKEFFSNDPKIATTNLTADMIDQVQVFNDIGEQAKFSGIDDGSRMRAINLKLKKDKKAGVLAKAYAGVGTNNRFNAGLSTNYFKGASQLSILAGLNNINKTAFTASDNASANGSRQGTGGIGFNNYGITESSLLGINYKDIWSRYFDVNGSYSYNQTNTNNSRKSYKQNFLNDSTITSSREAESKYINKNHRANLRLVYLLDSMNTIIYMPNLNFLRSDNISSDTATDYINKKSSFYKGSDSRTVNDSHNEGSNLLNNLIWRRKFLRKGRTFTASLSSSFNNNQMTGFNSIKARFYDSTGKIYRQRSSDYQTFNDFKRSDHALTLSYTEPINSTNILEFNYGYRNNKDEADRKASLYNPVSKQYDEIEDSLTNLFSNENQDHKIGANWRSIKKKYNYQLGLALQQVFMESQNKSKGISLGKSFFNVIPLGTFNFQLARNKNIQVNYRGRSNQPALSQLQDITDISSYPFIRKGNPDLKQEFIHNLMLTYNSFSMPKMHSVFATIMYNNTRNKIANSIVQAGGEQVLKPVNVNGVDLLTGTFTYGVPIKQMEGGNFSTTSTINHYRQINFINNKANIIKNLSLEEEINLNFLYKEKIDVALNAGISFNSVSYSIQNQQSSSYLVHNYSLDISYDLSNDFFISIDLNYTGFSGDFSDNNQNFLLWNASLTKQIFKNRRGALSLSVHDLLNQNRYISRNVYDNTLEDIQNIALKRFALLTFTYHLNQLGKIKLSKSP